MKRFASVDLGMMLILGYWIIAVAIVVIVVYIASPTPKPSTIEVFSARFDECMATEQFTREECIAYADEGE